MDCALRTRSCHGTISKVKVGDLWVWLCERHMEMSGLQPEKV